MSRTDVHRPRNVQIADPHNRPGIVRYQGANVWPLWNTCGCPLCTGQAQRKLARRIERTRLRGELRRAVTLARVTREDIDVPHPGRSNVW